MQDEILRSVKQEFFRTQYADVFKGDEHWQGLNVPTGETYAWQGDSTYVKNPPYFEGMTMQPPGVKPVTGAKALARTRRLDHHRPHLAGGQHSRREPRREVAHRARRSARRTSTRTARAAATTK